MPTERETEIMNSISSVLAENESLEKKLAESRVEIRELRSELARLREPRTGEWVYPPFDEPGKLPHDRAIVEFECNEGGEPGEPMVWLGRFRDVKFRVYTMRPFLPAEVVRWQYAMPLSVQFPKSDKANVSPVPPQPASPASPTVEERIDAAIAECEQSDVHGANWVPTQEMRRALLKELSTLQPGPASQETDDDVSIKAFRELRAACEPFGLPHFCSHEFMVNWLKKECDTGDDGMCNVRRLRAENDSLRSQLSASQARAGEAAGKIRTWLKNYGTEKRDHYYEMEVLRIADALTQPQPSEPCPKCGAPVCTDGKRYECTRQVGNTICDVPYCKIRVLTQQVSTIERATIERCAKVCEAMCDDNSGHCNNGLMRNAWLTASSEIRSLFPAQTVSKEGESK